MNIPTTIVIVIATIDATVVAAVQDLKVSPTDIPKYSLTIQNPESFTCDKPIPPAPIAAHINARFTSG